MVRRRVPIARRNLFQEPRRAALAISGVAAALLLVLVLDGVFAGAMRQVTAYIDSSPADVFVAQAGVRTMHMSVTALPDGTVDAVRAVDGVAWAESLRYTTGIVAKGEHSLVTYVLGYDTSTSRAGPRRLVEGAEPGMGEVVVDEEAADELRVGVGDPVEILGVPLVVSGLSAGGTNIVNTTVYVDARQFAAMRGPGTNYVLAGATLGVSGDVLADRIAAALPDATVQTRHEFSQEEAKIVRDMATDVMGIMTLIGLLIALSVVGLTLFTVTLAKLREYGIVKAIGGSASRLGAVVAGQALMTVALATLLAVCGALVLGAAIAELTPNVRVLIEPAAVVRTGMQAAAIGLLAAAAPLRRVLRVDPASAFRRAS